MFKTPAPFSIADEQEFDFWILTDEFGRDGEQIIVALELEQPGNFADDEIAGRDAEGFRGVPDHFSPQEKVRAESR